MQIPKGGIDFRGQSGYIKQCFPNLYEHKNHVGLLIKMQIPIQQVRARAWSPAVLDRLLGCMVLGSADLALSRKALIQSFSV